MAALRPKIPPRPSARPPPAAAAATPPADKGDAPPLYRRILYPPSSSIPTPRILHSPSHDLLDPLILDLIALSLRAYVSPWYNGSISRDPDKHFLQAVTNVLVHVVQALEVRLAALDWSALVLQDLPQVLTEHYRDWDLAEEKSAPAGTSSDNTRSTSHNLSRDELFDRIHPHLAVHLVPPADAAPLITTPATLLPPLGARVDPVYLRALTDHLLKLVLPPEDYRSVAERAIVREILVGVVFRTVFERVTQPWFLYALIAKQLEPRIEAKRAAAAAAKGATATAASRGRIFAGYVVPTLQGLASRMAIHPSLLALLSAILPPSLFLTQLVSLTSLALFFLSDRVSSYLSSLVTVRLANAQTAQTVLEAIKGALFPLEGGWPAMREADPDQEEREEWKRRAEVALAEFLPDWLPFLLTTTPATESPESSSPSPSSPSSSDEQRARIDLARHLLRPLASHTANVHLFVLILDLVVGHLAPEMVTGEGWSSE
ncbi:hypothetical protein RHOSPDRAFT_32446 [Rhodotorula sp. JG-1b]|nr:hypothetical protein RHOSPDRAFT_32446 [Rhodotorula sp. JG-1b]